ncbi:MAG: carboxylating nicotinate-nucleotide diphosphorylase [Deltaproteobacteria bacterium]|nr:carboxylating nicotinate-nucleotide diphosphorylase [Deltaproteobacteria bacterium]MBW2414374.1 carboxylating nicotinate-nucleotide diphosphorylase [Deltaproteobacteria bacterium]
MPLPPRATWLGLVDAALAEDVGTGDATTIALVPAGLRGSARLEVREPLTICGLEVAREVFERFGADLEARGPDGSTYEPGEIAARVTGPAGGILTAERTALNFLQRLSGVATHTRRFCDAVAGTRAEIVDTRKTTPGWRALEKYAVRCGGGVNHRSGLYDGVLIKDNHIAISGSVGDAVKRARANAPASLRIQVEVESEGMAREAIDAGADLILIDNQPPGVLAQIVELARGRVPTEATGGVTLTNVAEIARTGVDRISIGALTHSAPAVDLSLEWSETSTR